MDLAAVGTVAGLTFVALVEAGAGLGGFVLGCMTVTAQFIFTIASLCMMEGLGWQDQVCLQCTNMNWSCEVECQCHLAARQWGHGVCHIGVYGICYRQWAWCWHDPGQLGWSSPGGDVETHRGATHDLQLWCWPWHGVRLFLYCWCLQAVLPWCMLHCTLGHGCHLSLSLQDGCLLHFYSWLYQQTICHKGVFPQCWLVLCQLSSHFPCVNDRGPSQLHWV